MTAPSPKRNLSAGHHPRGRIRKRKRPYSLGDSTGDARLYAIPGGQITCPWHSSSFDLCSGENLDWVVGFAGRGMPRWSQKLVAMGRQPSPLTTYTVARDGDELFVDL